jgi:hypothetical protein
MSWNSPTTFPPTLTEVLGVTLTFSMREHEFITHWLTYGQSSRSAAAEWQQKLVEEADEALDNAEKRDPNH